MSRTQKPPVPLEKEVQASCIAQLRHLGWRVHRRNVGGFKKGDHFIKLNDPGMADTWGRLPFWDKRRFELEIKRPGKRPTAKQLEWLKENTDEHCQGFWVDNVSTLLDVATKLAAGYSILWGEGDEYDLIRL